MNEHKASCVSQSGPCWQVVHRAQPGEWLVALYSRSWQAVFTQGRDKEMVVQLRYWIGAVWRALLMSLSCQRRATASTLMAPRARIVIG